MILICPICGDHFEREFEYGIHHHIKRCRSDHYIADRDEILSRKQEDLLALSKKHVDLGTKPTEEEYNVIRRKYQGELVRLELIFNDSCGQGVPKAIKK